jgi:hypothetical protein
MTLEKRGVQHLKTLAGLLDGRRNRTPSGALLELSMLAMEKQRLTQEMRRAERRCAEIQARVAEIDKKGIRLQRFVDKYAEGASTCAASTIPLPLPLPIHTPRTESLKRRRMSY